MKGSFRPHTFKDLIIKASFCCFINICPFSSKAQAKYPIDLKIIGIGFLSLTNDVVLHDTSKVKYSENTFLRFVIFDPKGKSYFEIYKNDKLFAKGYLKNSLDTLKTYTSAISADGRFTKIEVLKYFQPLKNGEWVELINGKYTKRKYNMGVLAN